MDRNETLRAQLPHTLREADFPGSERLGTLYRGKVRDNFSKDDRIVMVTSDRLSAFDKVLTTVPFKGELLNRLTAFWFEKTRDLADNHLLDVPDPSVLVVRRLQPLAVEVVVRGHLTGSLWRDVQAGRGARAYGLELPAGLRKDQAFEKAILTPSTKEAVGSHDLPISPAELVAKGTVTQRQWDELSQRALALFARGQQWARTRGLILVDTKYEFGIDQAGKLWLIDEIHTADSSRYWIAEGSEERFTRGEEQKMLDKEFIRQWLIAERQWQGEGPLPQIPDQVRMQLADRYCALVEQLTGEAPRLVPGDTRARIEAALRGKGYL
jgi:phosphoribosylaminoimidazole-succinocarboxamide synthase